MAPKPVRWSYAARLRVDGLTGEMRRGFAGVRAELRGLHETDDELRRRIEAQERRGA